MSTAAIVKLILIVFCTGIIGGAIAFLGNQLGRFIGRKKLSIFGLRPRYTSMLITVLTGMMIASLTLTVAIVASEPIRVALVRFKEFTKEYEDLISDLREAREKDRQSIIVYGYQDIILSADFTPERDKKKMEGALKALIAKTNEVAIEKSKDFAKKGGRSYKSPQGGRLVGYIRENLDSVAEKLRRASGEQVIFVRANQNAILGQPFTVVIGNPFQNRLIFRKGEYIVSAVIDGTRPKLEIWNELILNFKGKVITIAVARGIIPNPETNKVGEIDPNHMSDIISKIKNENKSVTVDFFSKKDTHILGPLELELKIKDGGSE